jgi:hypothetical protein
MEQPVKLDINSPSISVLPPKYPSLLLTVAALLQDEGVVHTICVNQRVKILFMCMTEINDLCEQE